MACGLGFDDVKLQGSALWPLPFLAYVNDVPSQVSHGCLLQVADDTCLICSGDSAGAVVQMLQEDLRLSLWDEAKSSVMWFSIRSPSVDLLLSYI